MAKCTFWDSEPDKGFSFVCGGRRDSIDEFMEYNSCILLSLIEKMNQDWYVCDSQEEYKNTKSLERKQRRKCIVLDFPIETGEKIVDELQSHCPTVLTEESDTVVFRNSEPLPGTVVSSNKKKHGSFKNFLKRVLSLTR